MYLLCCKIVITVVCNYVCTAQQVSVPSVPCAKMILSFLPSFSESELVLLI